MNINKMKFHFVKKSGNKKTGFMPITYNSRLSCPDSCIFKKENNDFITRHFEVIKG